MANEPKSTGSEGKVHSVKKGETVLSIARDHKFRSWEAIWNHPGNNSLKERRKDPQVLAEGDRLFIPEKNVQPHSLETNKRHVFKLKPLRAWFRTQVIDDTGRALANKKFQLSVGDKSLEGFTDENARIEVPIDPKPSTPGVLKVFMGTTPERILTWNLKLGELDPIDKLTGVKARLTNLGFSCGEINETLDEETKAALRNFQVVYRLEVTGEPDEATRAKLLAVHDKR
jgi:hypothetical protein